MSIAKRLAELGITLPHAAPPAANYVPYVQTGSLLFIAGQLPFIEGQPQHRGLVGRDVSLEQGREAARFCAINILAQVQAASGDLERIRRCVKLGAFVASPAEFTDHPKVVNGASDLLVELLGDRGRHARFAVGAPSLPLNAAVEIDAIFELA